MTAGEPDRPGKMWPFSIFREGRPPSLITQVTPTKATKGHVQMPTSYPYFSGLVAAPGLYQSTSGPVHTYYGGRPNRYVRPLSQRGVANHHLCGQFPRQ